MISLYFLLLLLIRDGNFKALIAIGVVSGLFCLITYIGCRYPASVPDHPIAIPIFYIAIISAALSIVLGGLLFLWYSLAL